MRIPYPNELKHYGIPGMRKGVRRYQNEDGSLTAAGRDRYGVGQYTDVGTGASARSYRPQTGRTTHVTGSGSVYVRKPAEAKSTAKQSDTSRRGVRMKIQPKTSRGQSGDSVIREYEHLSHKPTAREVKDRASSKADFIERSLKITDASRPVYYDDPNHWAEFKGARPTAKMQYYMRDLQDTKHLAEYLYSKEHPDSNSAIWARERKRITDRAKRSWEASNAAAQADLRVARQNASTLRSLRVSGAIKKASSAVKSTASSAVKSLTSWATAIGGLFGGKKKKG